MVWLRMCGVSPTSRRALTARRFRFSSLSPLGSSRRWLAGLVLAFGLLGGTAATSSAALVLSVGIGNSQATALSNLAVVSLGAPDPEGVYNFNGAFSPNYTLTIQITTNQPGTETLADLLTVNTTVRGNGGGSSHYLAIQVIGEFEQPVNPISESLVLHGQLSGDDIHQNSAGLTSFVQTENSGLIASVGPISSGSSSVAFENEESPFKVGSLQQFFVTPKSDYETTARTWVTGVDGTNDGPDDGPGGQVVPEPSAVMVWLLMGLSMVGVGLRRQGRRQA